MKQFFSRKEVLELSRDIIERVRENMQCPCCDSMDTEFSKELEITCNHCGDLDRGYQKLLDKFTD